MVSDFIITVMEWIGTVAFAVSGSLIAISCSLDLFGVVIVGSITAVGGGITRDLLLGITPPSVFLNSEIMFLSLLTSLAVFVIARINEKRFAGLRMKIEKVNLSFDAMGLAAFSVTGTEIVCATEFSHHMLMAIIMGVITGVGGGVLRDILVNKKPYVLTKHVYAIASASGSVVYYLFRVFTDYKILGTCIAVFTTVMIRFLAIRFRWKLPKIKVESTAEL